MRRILSLIVAVAMCFGLEIGEGSCESIYKAGVYEASVNGMNGSVDVKIEFSDSAIIAVTASGEKETKGLGDVAIEKLTQTILEQQSADVDTVAGATVSSTAMLKAAADCINQAKGIVEETVVETEVTADVIVVGAGAAGLSAAASAVAEGASVIVLETNSFLGGAAGTSMGNILHIDQEVFVQEERNDTALAKYAGYSAEQFPEPWKSDYAKLMEQIDEYTNNGNEKGKFVTFERVMVDHYVKGMGKDLEGNVVTLDYDMIRAGVEAAQDIYVWLQGYGLTTTPLMEYVSTPAGRGMGLIELLNKAAEGADIRLSTRARELVVEDGKVTGVIAEDGEGNQITFRANSGVVLATGSFSSNGEMIAQYQKIGTGLTANIPSNNPAGNRGDGIVMAEKVGAALRDMSFMQTYLKGYQNLATSGEAGNVFKSAQLVVNTDAVRFADDSNQSKIVSRYGNDQEDGIIIAVGDAKMIEALNGIQEGMSDELINRGMAYKADTIEEAAQLTGLDAEALKATITTYNGYVDAGADADYGRTAFNGKVENGPYYIAKLQLAAHLTFGGLVIDQQSQVLDTNGAPIAGLYAAGDVTSGYEGIVHQTGNCLTIIINTGRIAGENAAELKTAAHQVAMGEKYYYGNDVEQSYEEAAKWFQLAADQGDPNAITWVGKCYYNGEGLEQNYDEAIRLFHVAADLGHVHAYTWIGKCYYHGNGVEQSYEEAAKWFQLAADLGNSYGITQIGRLYYLGQGVEQDYEAALKYNLLGAEAGYTYVYQWLGDAYYYGNGTEQDYSEALKWYQLGADHGHAQAIIGLARCYCYGHGVEQSNDEAHKWLDPLAEKGNEEAISLLNEIQ